MKFSRYTLLFIIVTSLYIPVSHTDDLDDQAAEIIASDNFYESTRQFICNYRGTEGYSLSSVNIYLVHPMDKINLRGYGVGSLDEDGMKKIKDLAPRELDFGYNGIHELPDSLFDMNQLTSLKIDGNYVPTLSSKIGQLTSLTRLVLDVNDIESLPSEIGMLKKLKRLQLTCNRCTDLPSDIGNTKSLEHLEASYNQIEKIPDSIVNLEKLEWLGLEANKLTTLPDGIERMPALTKLKLGGNKFSQDEINRITNLFEGTQVEVSFQ